MKLKQLKLEFFYLRQAARVHHAGWRYLYNKFFLAEKIKKINQPLEKPLTNQNLSIHILTCHRDTTATLWALASFYHAATTIGQLFIHNDGSLTNADESLFKKFFPSAKLINAATVTDTYKKQLRVQPTLLSIRQRYANFSLKKIIDPYIVSDKQIRLLIDSDILWYRQPTSLEALINSGAPQSAMQLNNGITDATFSDGIKLEPSLNKFNAGIILYNIANFDTDKLAEFFNRLDTKNPRNLHFADQTGHPYCLQNLIALPSETYTIKQAVTPATVARHYTGPRRTLLYLEGIPRLANAILKA